MRTGYWVGLFLACAITVSAQFVPASFNYQGVLRDGSGQLLGAVSKTVDFRLYDQAAGGTAVWGRTFAVLLDTNGLFNVELSDSSGVSLGSATNTLVHLIANNQLLYLGLTVQGVNPAEIAPRQQLLSVPFAMMAGDVRSATGDFAVTGAIQANGGLTVGGLLQANGGVKDKNGDLIPAGTVFPFAGYKTTPPGGWLWCDGSAVPKATYPDLYAAIGTTYGPTNALNFVLPDLRGRTVIGEGQGPLLTSRIQGTTVGEETHTLTQAEMPNHQHTLNTKGSASHFDSAWGSGSAWQDNASALTGTAGSNAPHFNMQPSLVLKYMIKY